MKVYLPVGNVLELMILLKFHFHLKDVMVELKSLRHFLLHDSDEDLLHLVLSVHLLVADDLGMWKHRLVRYSDGLFHLPDD
jgi:hypothetical protein